MTTPTFNPKKVSVYFKGKILSGFAPGSFVEWARNGDSFAVEVGADGEGARVASQDFSGTVKVMLQQTSRSNDDLSALIEADEQTQDQTGPLFVKDASGRTLLSAPEAWIKKPADGSFGKDLSPREWIFESALIKLTIGGN